MSITPALIWLAAMVVLLLIEAAVPGLVSIWFAIGALAAFVSALFGAPVWLQIVWFFVVSAVFLVLTRPLAKKYINSRVKHTNADMAIGSECIVTEEVSNLRGTGAVNLRGRIWTARSEDDSVIPAGSKAVAVRIEGVKLIIKQI